MTLWSAATLLFFVLDPFGNVPKVLVTLRHTHARRREQVLLRELVIALMVIVTFLFLGRRLLELMQLSQEAVSVGGAIVLFLIAVRMIFPTPATTADNCDEEPFVVPLAIPYIAGPATLATVTLMGSDQPERWPVWLGAVVIAWLAAGTIILLGNRLAGVIGRRGLVALERLMGMILVAISVEMLLRGLRAFQQTL